MELLNNIWVALSTPNEFLINLIYIPGTFIEAYFIYKIFSIILKLEPEPKQRNLYIILSGLSGIISKFLLPEPFNTLLNYLAMFIFIFKIFKLNILKTFIALVLPIILYALIGTFVTNPYLTALNIESTQLVEIPIYKIGYLLVVYILMIGIILLLKLKNCTINKLDEIDNKTKGIMYITIALGIVTLLIQAFVISYYIDKLPVIITFFSFLSLLAYFSISIYSLTRVMKLTQTTQKLESAEEYNKTLRILHDNVRGFKHDFDNIVSTIDGYIRDNDMDRLKKYFSQLSNECQRLNNLYILNPNIINNPGLYNLLTSKYHESDSKDIKFNVTCLLDLNAINMKIYEFARILGILLDNAIEASEECEEKVVNIIFRDDDKHHRQLVTIENTYNNRDVDTIKIFEKNVSGKDNHSGIGLWEVNKILNKNKNVSLFTSKGDKYFSQQLEIYYK